MNSIIYIVGLVVVGVLWFILTVFILCIMEVRLRPIESSSWIGITES